MCRTNTQQQQHYNRNVNRLLINHEGFLGTLFLRSTATLEYWGCWCRRPRWSCFWCYCHELGPGWDPQIETSNVWEKWNYRENSCAMSYWPMTRQWLPRTADNQQWLISHSDIVFQKLWDLWEYWGPGNSLAANRFWSSQYRTTTNIVMAAQNSGFSMQGTCHVQQSHWAHHVESEVFVDFVGKPLSCNDYCNVTFSGRFLQTPGLLQPGGVQSPARGEPWKSHGSTEARRGLAKRGMSKHRSTQQSRFDAEKFQYLFNCSASNILKFSLNSSDFRKHHTTALHSTPQHLTSQELWHGELRHHSPPLVSDEEMRIEEAYRRNISPSPLSAVLVADISAES